MVHTFRDHIDRVNSIQFSHDGRLLAASVSGSNKENQEVRVWNVISGKLLLRLESKSGGLGKYARFSPDGTRILTIGRLLQKKTGKKYTDVAQLWNLATGELELIIDYGSVNAAEFSKGGDWLIVSSRDGTVRLFRLFEALDETIAHAKSIIKRCMTPLEREKTFLSSASPDWCNAAQSGTD